MKRALLLTLLLSSICIVAQGQNTLHNVLGKVVDATQTPLDGVVVVLFDADSTYLNSTITDIEGNFKFTTKVSSYKLIFQHISYEELILLSDVEDIGVVTLNDNIADIGEVVVIGERPFVKIKDGKLAYDLQAISKNRAVNNAYEAIAKIPGVRENSGQLVLAGSGALNIIINGKPSTMTADQLASLLKSTPVDRIEKAELMYSTQPRYNVRGASINLVLRRNYDYSITGQIDGNYTTQNVDSWKAGGNMLFSAPKWSTDITYSGGRGKKATHVDLLSRHTLDGTLHEINQNQELEIAVDQHNVRAAIEYAPEGKNSFSAIYSGEFHPTTNKSTNADGTFVKSQSHADADDGMHNIALRYTSPEGLDLGVDYTHYKNSSLTSMRNIYTTSSDITSFKVNSGQTIDKIHTYLDMTNSITNGWDISYGASFDWSTDKDFQRYSVEQGDVPIVNTDVTLKEYVGSGYVGFSKQLSKGNLSASLTGEHYQLEDYKRWALFPQASFLWQFDDSNLMQLSLSSNKAYPSFWEMQQAVTYIDGYSEIHGNILLKPMLNYSTQLVYMLKSEYIFVLFWNEQPDYFEQTVYQSPDRLALIYQPLNWDFNRQYGFNISAPFRIGDWLDSRATFTGLNMRQKCSSFYDLSFDRSRLLGVVQLDNNIKVSQKPSIALNISGSYQTAAIQGTYDIDPSWGVDGGITWKFARERATISAKCTDIFNTTIPFTKVRFGNQNLDMATGAFSRAFTLNFAYRFGGYKEKHKDKVDTSRFGH